MKAPQLVNLPLLPPDFDLESQKVLKALPAAHAALAELKMLLNQIPIGELLLHTLSLIEAKESSEIENIITTHDELYKSQINLSESAESKEVRNYHLALKMGYEAVKISGLLTSKTLLTIQQFLEENNAGYRRLPGTVLRNSQTNEVVYTPPQDYDQIILLMTNLERYINEHELSDVDPIVKMAVIHYQFESIHPFYDGNGRTGRIINILYLILSGLQDIPVLYLSKYIIENKFNYYELLRNVNENKDWEPWLLYMITGVTTTAKQTTALILSIKELIDKVGAQLANYKFYSQELLYNLFKYPYTKIEFVERDVKVSRITAANYLNKLAADGLLKKESFGPANYYINEPLVRLLGLKK